MRKWIEGGRYKWFVVSACFLMVFVCLGFCSSTKGLYLSAVTSALDIKRSLFSINDSCRFITTAIINLFFGVLIEKLGPRKLIGLGFASLTASMLIYSFATHIYVFYIGGVFLGLGLAWTTTTMVGYIVNMWCSEHRGTIMGFVLAANGLGGAVASQVISPMIYNEADLFGYRTAYKVTALLLFAVGVIVVLVVREKPGIAVVAKGKKEKASAKMGLPLREILRRPSFYVMGTCVLLTGVVLQSVAGVAAAHMKDIGLDAEYVALVVSVHSLALAGFKALTGVLYDRFGLRTTILICDIAAVVSVAMIFCIAPTLGGMVLAMCYGVISSLALPLETIMLPLLTSDLFGKMSYAKILGIVISLNTAGYAIGTPLTNLIYDMCGSYKPIFLVFIGVMLLISVCTQWIIRVENRENRRACEEKIEESTHIGNG